MRVYLNKYGSLTQSDHKIIVGIEHTSTNTGQLLYHETIRFSLRLIQMAKGCTDLDFAKLFLTILILKTTTNNSFLVSFC